MIRRIILPAVLLVLAVLSVSISQAYLSVPGVSVGRDHVNELLQATSSPVANVEVAGESSPDRQRVEPTIAVDPHNPSIIVAGAQDLSLKAIGEHRWHGYYRSTDGGQTWSSSLLPGFPGDTSPQGLLSPLHRSNATSDPVMAFDRNGNLYYTGIVFNASSANLRCPGNCPLPFVAKYVNDGADYSNVTLMTSWFNSDKPWIAVDTTGGPYDGNVYLVFYSPGGFARSTDGGKTFSKPASGGGTLTGVTVDPSGAVFVVSEDSSGRILVSKSVDGGLSFSAAVIAASGLKPLSGLPGNGFRVFTNPQIATDNKGIYVVADNNGTGSSDVLFIGSTNGGQSWTAPLRVDPEANDQFDPSIAVSAGTISVVWYDSRMGQLSNGTITALDVFIAQSRNAGVSFSPGTRVTSVSFDPNKVLRTDWGGNTNDPFIGDYIDIAAIQGAVYPVWTDNRNACDTVDLVFGCVDQDVFTVPEKVSLPVSSFSSLDGSSVSINGVMLVDRLLPGVSGNLTVTTLNSTTGAMIFSKTYSVPSLPLTNVSGPASQSLFALNVAVMPYSLSVEVKVILQGTTVTSSTLLTRELDLDANGSVDIIDAGIAALSFGTSTGNPKYNPQADFLAHGTVDIVDLGVFAFYFNAPVFH